MSISTFQRMVRRVRPRNAVLPSLSSSSRTTGTLARMRRVLRRVVKRVLLPPSARPAPAPAPTPAPAPATINLEELATKNAWFYDHFVKVPQMVADLLARAIALKSATVLDFGCGEGLMAKGLARYVHKVHGVEIATWFPDVEERFTQMFGEYSPFPPVKLQVVQAGDRLPYEDGYFDAVFAWSVFEHVADVPFAFSEIHRVLRPGGVFLLQIYPLYYSPYGAHLWDVLNEPWIHLKLGQEQLLDRIERASLGGEPDQICHDTSAGQNAEEYRASVIACQDTLNRVTVGELTDHLRAAGFTISYRQTWHDSTNKVPTELLGKYSREDLVTDHVVMLASR
jgi:SAM-dependent methyltransferase